NVGGDVGNILGCTLVDVEMNIDGLHAGYGQYGGAASGARRIAQAILEAHFADPMRATGPIPGTAPYDPESGWVTIDFTVAGDGELVGRVSQEGLTGFAFTADGALVEPLTEPFVSGP